MADAPLPIDVNGTVRVENDGMGFDVVAQGDRVMIELPDVATLKKLLDGPGDRGQLRWVAEMLQRYAMGVEIKLKGQTIATLGRDADPGTFEKMFSLGAVDVNKRKLIKALFSRDD
ncbi:MAG: hypothetical protein AAF086_00795 [Planctomycetota bacterium]